MLKWTVSLGLTLEDLRLAPKFATQVRQHVARSPHFSRAVELASKLNESENVTPDAPLTGLTKVGAVAKRAPSLASP